MMEDRARSVTEVLNEKFAKARPRHYDALRRGTTQSTTYKKPRFFAHDDWTNGANACLSFGCVANIGGVGPSQLPLVYPSLSMSDDPTPVLPFMAGAGPNQPPVGTCCLHPAFITLPTGRLLTVFEAIPPRFGGFCFALSLSRLSLRIYLSFRLLLAAIRGKKAIDPAIAARKSSVFQAAKEHQPPLGVFEKVGWLHKATAPKQSPQTWRAQTPNRQLPTP
jgi:hypothetical protein